MRLTLNNHLSTTFAKAGDRSTPHSERMPAIHERGLSYLAAQRASQFGQFIPISCQCRGDLDELIRRLCDQVGELQV